MCEANKKYLYFLWIGNGHNDKINIQYISAKVIDESRLGDFKIYRIDTLILIDGNYSTNVITSDTLERWLQIVNGKVIISENKEYLANEYEKLLTELRSRLTSVVSGIDKKLKDFKDNDT